MSLRSLPCVIALVLYVNEWKQVGILKQTARDQRPERRIATEFGFIDVAFHRRSSTRPVAWSVPASALWKTLIFE